MPSVDVQFEKFRHRLEISVSEQEDAARRHHQVRDLLRDKLNVAEDFLTGSYDRHTKTRPLHDVDVFVVLANAVADDDPQTWLRKVHRILADHYGDECVMIDTPAVRVDFGAAGDE